MDRIINKVKLYVKDTNRAHEAEKTIKNALNKYNFNISEDADIEISIGGDGTFLKMIHHSNFNRKYYTSINAGSLGFLSSVNTTNIEDFIRDINNNNYDVREYDLLKIDIYHDEEILELYALNEFTIRTSDFSTFKADLLINNKLLEKFNGDGLVINTTVGSTAYNEALNGPIMDIDTKTFCITPIVPINNKVYRSLTNSLVLSDNKKVTIIPVNNSNLCYLVDGKKEIVNNINKVDCYLDKKITCILPSNYNYLDTVKNKIIDTKE